jgi:hypothetical protein
MSLQLLCKGLETSIAVAGLAAYDSASEEREKSPGLPGVAVEEVSAGKEIVESSEYETWVENKHLLGGGLLAAVCCCCGCCCCCCFPSIVADNIVWRFKLAD